MVYRWQQFMYGWFFMNDHRPLFHFDCFEAVNFKTSCVQMHFHLHFVPQVLNHFSVTCAKAWYLWTRVVFGYSPPPMIIICDKSLFVSELNCCVWSTFFPCYYCVCCANDGTEKPPDRNRLHSALGWLTDSCTHWMYCRTVFKTHRIV